MSEEDDDIVELWDYVEGRTGNHWLRRQAVEAMTELQVEHGHDTTEMVLSLRDDSDKEVRGLVAIHFRKMLDMAPDLSQIAKGHIETLIFDPEMQPHVIHELHDYWDPHTFDRHGENTGVRQWVFGQLLDMFELFHQLNTDSKCYVADAIIHQKDPKYLLDFFKLTRSTTSRRILEKTAMVLFILDSDYQDPRDPEYFHEKLLELDSANVFSIRFWQDASCLNHSVAGENNNYDIACTLLRSSTPLNSEHALLRRFVFQRIIDLYGSSVRDCRDVGILALGRLRRDIPIEYIEKVLDPDNSIWELNTKHRSLEPSLRERTMNVIRLLEPVTENSVIFERIMVSSLPTIVRLEAYEKLFELVNLEELSAADLTQILARIEQNDPLYHRLSDRR